MFTFAILLATCADVAALYRLRSVQRDRPRPYRAWGYPWVPGLYFVANAAIAVALLVGRPFECAVGLGLAAAIERCGDILATEFPIGEDDVNELKDTLIIRE